VPPFWPLFKETFIEWDRDNVSRSAAALAFYMVLSLAPALVIIVAIGGAFAGSAAALSELTHQIRVFVGPRAAEVVAILSEVASQDSATTPTIVGFLVALFGATAIFVELQSSLNHIWQIEPKPGRFILRLLYTRFLSFLMVIGIGLLLLISLVAGAFLAAAHARVGNLLPVPGFVAEVTSLLLTFALMVVLFAAIYKILPDVVISWRDVWIGATITALFMALGRFLITLYLAHSSLSSVYGAAGSLVMFLLWVYYSAQIFLFGAEFTQVYAKRYGSRIKPAKRAVWRAGFEETPGT
jgi:membrane protein